MYSPYFVRSGRRRNCGRLFADIPRILEGQCWKKDFWSPLFLIYGQCRNIVRRHAVNLTHNVPFVKTYVIKISVWTLDWFDSRGKESFIPVSLLRCDFHPPPPERRRPPWSHANVVPPAAAEHLVRLTGEFWCHRMSGGCWKLLRWSADPPVQQNSGDRNSVAGIIA